MGLSQGFPENVIFLSSSPDFDTEFLHDFGQMTQHL